MRDLGRVKAQYTNEKHTFSDWIKDRFGFATIFFSGMGLFWLFIYLVSGMEIFLAVVITFILAILLFLYFLKKNSHNYVILHEYGFVFGNKEKAIPVFYDEIESTALVAEKVKVHRIIPIYMYSLTIEKRNGEKVKLDNGTISKVWEINSEIQQSFFRLKVPQLITSLQRGEAVNIGELMITSEGIRRRNKILLWNEVGAAQLENGYVWIMKKDQSFPWRGIKSNKPNALLLLELINAYIGQSSFVPYNFHNNPW